MGNYPVLKGFLDNGALHVYCPYCFRFHHHSAVIPGHRVAHCDSGGLPGSLHSFDESWKMRGYYVVPYSKKELHDMKLWIDDYLTNPDKSTIANDECRKYLVEAAKLKGYRNQPYVSGGGVL
jgi:hypothetical protein